MVTAVLTIKPRFFEAAVAGGAAFLNFLLCCSSLSSSLFSFLKFSLLLALSGHCLLDFLPSCWPLLLSLIPSPLSTSKVWRLPGLGPRTPHLFFLGVHGFNHWLHSRDSQLFLQPGDL